ncbi:hypothetical protein KUV50_17790 [Membranicola marinus]|uniref:Uncharacterized protein n=1 Tax=Membranihabitans marinus TaxID=1227546 RepID=A0A953HSA1_9BACT|nr:hypothetical protein [Membranihabitans marinus]MBY5960008.1 hypothetical protein [Membranihabitans marinus]
MNFRKKLLTGIGALAFMVIMALNVQLVNSSTEENDGFASLSIVELAAQAQGEVGCDCEDWEYCVNGICYPDDNSNNGLIDAMPCPNGGFWYTCGGTGNTCGTDDC